LAENPARLVPQLRHLADQARKAAPGITLLFVTNLRDVAPADVGPDGILNVAQYYTRAQAEEIIRTLQSLGVTVRSFFSETDFMSWALQSDVEAPPVGTVVFTTAEGGTGSGRRALVPAFCNLLGMPFLNSGAHACSIARHKFHANAVLASVGVRTPSVWLYSDGGWLGGKSPPHGTRVILKPIYESMCIGIASDSVLVVDPSIDKAVSTKQELFRQPVLVQEFVTGEEIGVPVVRLGSAYGLPPVVYRRANGTPYGAEPRTFADENIESDWSLKLFDGSAGLRELLHRQATLAFEALEMRGVGRIDFRVDADGRAWAFDTNESPPPLGGTAWALSMESLGFTVEEMLAVWLGACLFDGGLISGV
jgi:D-alanine-D-alanine ligase